MFARLTALDFTSMVQFKIVDFIFQIEDVVLESLYFWGKVIVVVGKPGDLFVLDEAELHQIEADLPPIGLLIVQGLLELVRSDALLF